MKCRGIVTFSLHAWVKRLLRLHSQSICLSLLCLKFCSALIHFPCTGKMDRNHHRHLFISQKCVEEREYFLPNDRPQKLPGGPGHSTLNQNSTIVDRVDLAEKIHSFLLPQAQAACGGSSRARTQSPSMVRWKWLFCWWRLPRQSSACRSISVLFQGNRCQLLSTATLCAEKL